MLFFCIRNTHVYATMCIASDCLHGEKLVLYFLLATILPPPTTSTVPQFFSVVCDLFPVEFPWNYGKSTYNTTHLSLHLILLVWTNPILIYLYIHHQQMYYLCMDTNGEKGALSVLAIGPSCITFYILFTANSRNKVILSHYPCLFLCVNSRSIIPYFW